MFWYSLLLFVGFTILGELLRPKPKFDTPEPSAIGDFQLPTAQEGRAIPVVWGTCKVSGPNVLWYGGLGVTPITEKVKSGLFSSTTVTTGYRYRLTVHLAICHGVLGDSGSEGVLTDENVDVVFDDRIPSQSLASVGADHENATVRGFGEQVALSQSDVTRPEKYQMTIDGEYLFGGPEREGGVSGLMDIYPGGLWNGPNNLLQTHLGTDIPAYRGIAHAVMRNMYIGNSAHVKPVSFIVRRCPSPKLFLDGDFSEDVNARIEGDANPAYIILEILTDNVWGMGTPSGLIDLDSFYAAATILKTEGLGMSYMLDDPVEASGVIQDVLRHIDAVLYTDPATGLITIKLARDDYSPDELPLFDQSNILSCEFSRGSWSETKNNVKVLYIEGRRNFTSVDTDVLLQCRFADGDSTDESSYESPFVETNVSVSPGVLQIQGSVGNPSHVNWTGAQFSQAADNLPFPLTIEIFLTIPEGLSLSYQHQLFFFFIDLGNARRILTFQPVTNNHLRYLSVVPGNQTAETDIDLTIGSRVHVAIVIPNDDQTTSPHRVYIGGELGLSVEYPVTPDIDPNWNVVVGTLSGQPTSFQCEGIRIKRGEVYSGEIFAPPASPAAWPDVTQVLDTGSVKFPERPVQWQNLANIQSRSGEISAEVIRFHGISTAENATKVAARVGKTLSYPLSKAKILCNRDAWQLRPGSVFAFTWPPEGIEAMAMRVTRIGYGDLLNGRITIDAVEDIFGLADTGYSVIPETTWENPAVDPAPALAEALVELPYHFIGEDHRHIMTLAARSGGMDRGYEVWSDRNGGTDYVHTNTVPQFVPYGLLTAPYAKCTDALDATGFALESGVDLARLESITAAQRDQGVNLALIAGENGHEIVAWQTVAGNTDDTAATITNVVRGALDTVPLAHEEGAPVWFITDGFGTADTVKYPNDRTVTAKLLPFNGLSVLDIADAAELQIVLDSRALRPYPPGNALVNADPCPVEFIEEDVTLTWSHRHRVDQTENQEIPHQDDVDYTVTPEGDYIVEIYVGGVLEHTFTDFLPSTDPMAVTYTFAQRQIDSTDMDLPVKFVITPINDDDLTGTPREIEFLMSFAPADATRGLFFYGHTSSNSNVIDYIAVATTGNATDFGDASVTRTQAGACASATRALAAGGDTGSRSNVIDYVTIASPGNATDFGDLTVARTDLAGCSSSTRGLFSGGLDASAVSNVMDYVTIASAGNATDFGDLTSARRGTAALSSTTRGVIGSGANSGFTIMSNVMDYVTLASAGNATDFGDLTVTRGRAAGCASSTRGLFGGGYTGSASNVIDYITIASAGNATDFGDLTAARYGLGACSSPTRGVFGGGIDSLDVNVMDYVTIDSAGNATDFGDLTIARDQVAGASNGHGGL